MSNLVVGGEGSFFNGKIVGTVLVLTSWFDNGVFSLHFFSEKFALFVAAAERTNSSSFLLRMASQACGGFFGTNLSHFLCCTWTFGELWGLGLVTIFAGNDNVVVSESGDNGENLGEWEVWCLALVLLGSKNLNLGEQEGVVCLLDGKSSSFPLDGFFGLSNTTWSYVAANWLSFLLILLLVLVMSWPTFLLLTLSLTCFTICLA